MSRNFCGQCGNATTPAQKFCRRCGHELGTAAEKDIPGTRLGMRKVAPMSPTAKMSPTTPMSLGHAPTVVAQPQPQAAPANARPPRPQLPTPPVFEAPRRRRRWPWLALALMLLGTGSTLAGWFAAPLITRGFAARFAIPTFVGDAEVQAAPVAEGAPDPTFAIALASLPSSPSGCILATPVYRIEADGESQGPYELSLPLLDPSDPREVVVGHYHDGSWEPLATEVVDGRAIAVTDSFSPFAGWYPEEGGPVTQAERARTHVNPPRVLYGEVGPETQRIVFDLRGSTLARDGLWGRRTRVASLHVEVTRPEGELAAPMARNFAPYEVDGEPLRWDPREGEGVLLIPQEPLSRRYDANSTVTERRWDLRVVAVFADGTSAPASDAVAIYPDVLRALAHMNREVPLDPATRATFDARVAANPVRVVFGGYFGLGDAYNGSLGWSRRRGWGRLFGGVSGPHIGITTAAGYGEVVTHEWGHYAAHMALGDEYESTSPAGTHRGWVESTRALAFTEDLATVLGQWATGRGVPSAAGAMFGHTRDMSRHPEGQGARWPSARHQDAPAVETVPATVMSRLAHAIGFEAVFSTLATERPRDLLELATALGPTRNEVLQPIMLDEGVSWLVQGRVVDVSEDGAPPEPVEGAVVHVRTANGLELTPPEPDRGLLRATTLADGRFVVRVPPGEVLLVAEKAGLSQRARVTFSVDPQLPTYNAEPQQIGTDIEMEQGLEIAIETPTEGATVDERILLVTGRVTAREGTTVDSVMLGGVQAVVSGERFEGRVTLSPGENVVTATARAGDAEASASVTVEAEIEATILVCELSWNRDGTDVDLWVTDPENVTTGFRNRRPSEGGRLLDVDNTRGYGPETYTMSRALAGDYQVRVNYYSGREAVSFRVRWCVYEATPQEHCEEVPGTLSVADHNGSTPAGNHRFTVRVPSPPP